MFALVATVAVAAAVAWGFILVGSPAARRLERLDQQRIADLRTIAREIRDMVVDPNEKGKLQEALPKTLDEAAARARDQRVNPRDPETGEAYGYTVKNESTFELCAEFALPHESDVEVFWNHPAGMHCFTVNVLDPPPY
jgi:hypothetical protein